MTDARRRRCKPRPPLLRPAPAGASSAPAAAALIDTLLPRLTSRCPAGRPLDPAGLFPRPRRELWLEIGFGGGEHSPAQAAHHPDVGFIGCELFVNGIVDAAALVRATTALDNVRLWPDDARLLLAALPDGCGRPRLPAVPRSLAEAAPPQAAASSSRDTVDRPGRACCRTAPSCASPPTTRRCSTGCWQRVPPQPGLRLARRAAGRLARAAGRLAADPLRGEGAAAGRRRITCASAAGRGHSGPSAGPRDPDRVLQANQVAYRTDRYISPQLPIAFDLTMVRSND